MNWASDAKTIAQCGVLAALLEVSGYPKPGNVHRTRDFTDIRYEHFLFSSIALLPILEEVSNRGRSVQRKEFPPHKLNLGKSLLNAVQANQRWQHGGNTNLGIILLMVPLACAAGMLIDNPTPSVTLLRDNLDVIIRNSTSEDTIKLFEAIRLAEPGGLGTVDKYDLNTTPPDVLRAENINLYEIFKISANRDSIAKEWITKFQITFEVGYPYFKEIFKKTNDPNIIVVHTYLKILSDIPDTLISRKYGRESAEAISNRAKHILEQGGLLSEQSIELLWDFDLELRNKKKINPGTTADLTAATIMVALLEGKRF